MITPIYPLYQNGPPDQDSRACQDCRTAKVKCIIGKEDLQCARCRELLKKCYINGIAEKARKACNYCHKHKVKCLMLRSEKEEQINKCKQCWQRRIDCTFSPRKKSGRRRKKNQENAPSEPFALNSTTNHTQQAKFEEELRSVLTEEIRVLSSEELEPHPKRIKGSNEAIHSSTTSLESTDRSFNTSFPEKIERDLPMSGQNLEVLGITTHELVG
ncbi:MAG: Zn(II)2Cys6 transcription factor domain-containing protein [Chlamydiales bacterium]